MFKKLSPRLVKTLPCLVLMSLTSCVTTSSEPRTTVCLPVQNYSPALQDQVADELAALPDESALAIFIRDYGKMRDEARACAAAIKAE